MNGVVESGEVAQVSVHERTHGALERLKASGHFAEMRDAFRFGIALALARQVIPKKVEGPRRNLYSISTLDPDGSMRFAIEQLYDLDGESPYKVAERLGDWGVQALAEHVESEFKTIGDLLPADQG